MEQRAAAPVRVPRPARARDRRRCGQPPPPAAWTSATLSARSLQAARRSRAARCAARPRRGDGPLALEQTPRPGAHPLHALSQPNVDGWRLPHGILRAPFAPPGAKSTASVANGRKPSALAALRLHTRCRKPESTDSASPTTYSRRRAPPGAKSASSFAQAARVSRAASSSTMPCLRDRELSLG